MPTKDEIKKAVQLVSKNALNILAPAIGVAGASIALALDSSSLQTGALIATGAAAAASGTISVFGNLSSGLAVNRKCNNFLKEEDDTPIKQQAMRNFKRKHGRTIESIKNVNIAFQVLYGFLILCLVIGVIISVATVSPLPTKILMLITALVTSLNSSASALFAYLLVTPKTKAFAKEISDETTREITHKDTLLNQLQLKLDNAENDKNFLKKLFKEKNNLDDGLLNSLLQNKENIENFIDNGLIVDFINSENINREIFNPYIINLLVNNNINYDEISRLSKEALTEISKNSRCYQLLSNGYLPIDDYLGFTSFHVEAVNKSNQLGKFIQDFDVNGIRQKLAVIKNHMGEDDVLFQLHHADNNDESSTYSY